MRRLALLIPIILAVALVAAGGSAARQVAPTPCGQLGGPAPLATEPPPTPMPTVSATPDATGSPEASPTVPSDVPQPEECTVEPRSIDELLALTTQPAGTPRGTSREDGFEPDPITVTAIRTTIRSYIACVNADDLPRIAALSTDAHAAELVAALGNTPEEQATALATPMVRTERELTGIVAVEDILLHDQREASAVVVLDEQTGLGIRDLRRYHFFFVKVDDRWLVDAIQLGRTD